MAIAAINASQPHRLPTTFIIKHLWWDVAVDSNESNASQILSKEVHVPRVKSI